MSYLYDNSVKDIMIDLSEELYKFNPWWEREYTPQIVSRPFYEEYLSRHTGTKPVILITGLRRTGKTTLMKAHVRNLLRQVDPKYIFYASLDSLALEKFSVAEILREYRKVHDLRIDEKVYLFLDEVGYRDKVHQELKNLYDTENVKIFASSSSASILRDTGAMLTGRSQVLEVLPLDFHEFLSFKKIKVSRAESYLMEKYFEEYMKTGGMPEYVLTEEVEYLDSLVEGVIYRDIMAHYGVRDASSLRDFFRLLMERAGKQFSMNKVARIMGLSPDTVRRYTDYFAQTFLIYFMERCGKLNERLRAPKKIYCADVGIRNLVTGFRDKGAIFENLVYLRVKSHHPCYVYRQGIELDFLVDDTLIEVKYGQDLTGKQKAFFEEFQCSKKILVQNLHDYLNLVELH